MAGFTNAWMERKRVLHLAASFGDERQVRLEDALLSSVAVASKYVDRIRDDSVETYDEE